MRAEAEAIAGNAVRAVELAERAVAECERAKDTEFMMPVCHVLGLCRLYAGDVAGALSRCNGPGTADTRFSINNDIMRRLLADLVEALARCGHAAQARSVLAELHSSDMAAAPRSVAGAVQRARRRLCCSRRVSPTRR